MESGKRRVGAQLAHVFRTYVFTRAALIAILLTSPAILTTAVSLGIAASVDRSLANLNRDRATLAQDMGRLEVFMKEFDSYQLLRASFLLIMAADGDSQDLRYLLDRLYRQNAKGSLRRIAAVIYPQTWQETLKTYDGVVDAAYADKAAIDSLQEQEGRIIADAGAKATAYQAEINTLAGRIDRLESNKMLILTLGTSLSYVLTILIFFIRTADTGAPARPPS